MSNYEKEKESVIEEVTLSYKMKELDTIFSEIYDKAYVLGKESIEGENDE